MVTKYVEALVAHTPQTLPLAPNVRFTEDSRALSLGDGAWKTVTRAELIRVALTYPEGLRIGSFPDATPFAKDAYRVENGLFIAGEGCPRATWGGEIQAVNAFFRILPLETPRSWPSAR
jgi:hypothetical protein